MTCEGGDGYGNNLYLLTKYDSINSDTVVYSKSCHLRSYSSDSYTFSDLTPGYYSLSLKSSLFLSVRASLYITKLYIDESKLLNLTVILTLYSQYILRITAEPTGYYYSPLSGTSVAENINVTVTYNGGINKGSFVIPHRTLSYDSIIKSYNFPSYSNVLIIGVTSIGNTEVINETISMSGSSKIIELTL